MMLYGISNCNTVKKARNWLAQNGVKVTFHDFKKNGLDAATVQCWLQHTDWVRLVNRSSQTWHGLPENQKQQICDQDSAIKLMLAKPSVIKRPVLEQNGKLLHVGFDAAIYSRLFKHD